MRILNRLFRSLVSLLKLLIGAGFGIAVVALIFPSYLPVSKPSQRLASFSPKPLIDMHVHVAGLGYGGSGCFISPDLSKGYKKFFYLRAFGVTETELNKQGDQLVVKKLSKRISKSRFTEKAVVLGLDAVFDKEGVMKRSRTQVFVPNSFVLEETNKYSNLLYGASIHPYRTDAIELLRKAKQDGAVLIKWIPNIMHIDPADPVIIPFYKELIALNLPLLTHAGQEKSFDTAIDKYGDPLRLELPLKLGVKVIAAHIATTGIIEDQEMIDRLLPMFQKYPNLISDISSLTQINKLKYIDKGLLNKSLEQRLLYGSDWPLQFFPLVTPWLHINRISFADAHYISRQDNVFDRDILLKHALGIPKAVFEQTRGILGIDSVITE